MTRIQKLLLMAIAGLLCVCTAEAAKPKQTASVVDLDSILEHPEAWTPKTDRLRPTVQATNTHMYSDNYIFQKTTITSFLLS